MSGQILLHLGSKDEAEKGRYKILRKVLLREEKGTSDPRIRGDQAMMAFRC